MKCLQKNHNHIINRLQFRKTEIRAACLQGYSEIMIYNLGDKILIQPVDASQPANYTDRKIISFNRNRINIPKHFLKILRWDTGNISFDIEILPKQIFIFKQADLI